MRCPACGTENSAEAKRCTACGERMARRPRRREPADENDSPFGRRPTPALRAYRCAVYSLIPLAGLLLGPAAIVLAALAWRAGRRDPEARGNGYVVIALVLGAVTLLCNGLGLALMVRGLFG
jgi:hypothetical protein